VWLVCKETVWPTLKSTFRVATSVHSTSFMFTLKESSLSVHASSSGQSVPGSDCPDNIPYWDIVMVLDSTCTVVVLTCFVMCRCVYVCVF
jgi:hypothetical protein